MVGAFADTSGAALGGCADTLEGSTLADHDGLHDDVAVLELFTGTFVLGFPVGDSASEELLQADGGLLEDIKSMVDLNASDHVSDQTHLAGRCRNIVQLGDRCCLLYFFQPVGHFFLTRSHCDSF